MTGQVTTRRLLPSALWCHLCAGWELVERDGRDVYCRKCGEAFQCGECGYELDITGACQRPEGHDELGVDPADVPATPDALLEVPAAAALLEVLAISLTGPALAARLALIATQPNLFDPAARAVLVAEAARRLALEVPS